MRKTAWILSIIFFFLCVGSVFFLNQKIEDVRKGVPSLPKSIKPDSKYDNNYILAQIDIDAIQKSMVWLVTKTKFDVVDVWRGYIGKSEVDNIMIGSGFVVTLPQGFPKGKYIFTLDHIVSRDEFFVQTPPYGRRVNIVEKKISEKTYLRYNNKEVEIEELINDSSVDFALYKLPDDVSIPSFPYAFGRSNELQRGNVTYLLGRSGNLAEILLRRGIVANPIGWKFPIFFEEYEQYKNVINNMKKIHSWYSSDRVSQVTAGLNPGDSACPIVGLRDGVPELIAMAQATIPGREKMGLALKIDFILGLIKTFFELTPAHP